MKARAIADLMRLHNCFFASIGVLIGAIIGAGEIPSVQVTYALVAAAFISGGGNAINDYFDRELDSVNNPDRPIPSGRIDPSEALLTARVLFVVGIIFTIFTQEISCLIIAGINSALLSFYARDLKKRGLIGNITIGYLVGSTFLFGSLAVGEFETVGILALMAGLSNVGRELIKDVEDMKGDKKSKTKSFPLQYGIRKTALVASIFTLAAFGLTPLPYLWNIFNHYYLFTVLGSIGIFGVGVILMGVKHDTEAASRASLFYKLGMGLGLLAFLIGAIA